ncbi:response regulator [Oleiharenicola lentus]|uniref:response regulator n=1 Tax=Oleiharenicola lentus TaxID=2508720 RepID=UPI003F662062
MPTPAAKTPRKSAAEPTVLPTAKPAVTPVVEAVKKTKVLLVDDHPITRQGIKALVEQLPNVEICGEADSAPKAMELVSKLEPDLTIVDITLKSTNGIELTKNLRVQAPKMQILIVSMHDENIYAERALRAGAMGYLMKQEASENIITAIKRIQGGDIYLSDRIKEKMLHRLVNHRNEEVVSPIETLSDREMEVFQLIGNGYGTRQIATKLNLSVKTIDSYREHLKEKLNLPTGSELVRYSIQWVKSQGSM